ncbi:hypothetical protein [Streptomyces odontomachi]|uniref:hypothetical protein n=1 Tax=Streptomyces odontomachi TaxID=2944940 RepID=UPI00210C388D|nr:hypothetical protein [Streptomyces sp. ODS25]
MQRTVRRTTVSIVLLAAVHMLAGCSAGTSGGGSSGRPAGASSSAASRAAAPTRSQVTWLGKVCAADEDFQTQQSAARVVVLSFIPREPSRGEIVHFVKVNHQELRDKVQQFGKFRPAPVRGGDEVVAAYVGALKTAATTTGELQRTADDPASSHETLAGLPLEVSDALQAVLPKGADLPGLTARDPTAKQAYRAASDCRAAHPLTATASPTPGADA